MTEWLCVDFEIMDNSLHGIKHMIMVIDSDLQVYLYR